MIYKYGLSQKKQKYKKINEELIRIMPEIFSVDYKDLFEIIFKVQMKKNLYSETSTDSV